ncbi:hypothetical protein BT69DRAFT_1215225 [Atractiella rhizophila]|nr:hypothetical protein BT69DRAFT_1215225 [Atractiella rhizophila]
MIAEDDFPLCSDRSWVHLLSLLGKESCSAWIGTGGSGLVIQRRLAEKVSSILLVMAEYPTDLDLQDYLLGKRGGECSERIQNDPRDRVGRRKGMVVSDRLEMKHIGFNSSTVPGRRYRKSEFQCGWRHPFNGDPDVLVL